jgi:hypothetical protein
MKKTLTRLTGGVREHQTLPAFARIVMRMIATRDANARIASHRALQKSDSVKIHVLPAFSHGFLVEDFVARSNAGFIHPQRA